jgi:RND superfamily putative drug exporter
VSGSGFCPDRSNRGAVGSASRDEFSLPNVESRHGFDILNDEFGGQGAGQIGTIVFRAEQGVSDPEVKQQMEAFFAEVGDPRRRASRAPTCRVLGRRSQQGPDAGKIAFANVELPDKVSFTRANEIGKEIQRLAPQIDGVQIEVGGQVFASFEHRRPRCSVSCSRSSS